MNHLFIVQYYVLDYEYNYGNHGYPHSNTSLKVNFHTLLTTEIWPAPAIHS